MIYFKGQWDVQIKFIVEKKRVIGETLTELACEAVASQVKVARRHGYWLIKIMYYNVLQ